MRSGEFLKGGAPSIGKLKEEERPLCKKKLNYLDVPSLFIPKGF